MKIKKCTDYSVAWRSSKMATLQPIVGCLQNLSDKHQKTLSARSVWFYPLHATLLNFSAQARQNLVSYEKTKIAYLWVEYCIDRENGCSSIHFIPNRAGRTKADFLAELHTCIKFCFLPLKKRSSHGRSLAVSTRQCDISFSYFGGAIRCRSSGSRRSSKRQTRTSNYLLLSHLCG